MKTKSPGAFAVGVVLAWSQGVAAQGLPDPVIAVQEAMPGAAAPFEWVMLVSPEERVRLDSEAAELLRYLSDSRPVTQGLDGELLKFTVPPDLDEGDAILQLVPESLRGQIDRNDVYRPQE